MAGWRRVDARGGPEGWREFVASATPARANSDAIKVCREAAAKAEKEQKCSIIVTAPPTSVYHIILLDILNASGQFRINVW